MLQRIADARNNLGQIYDRIFSFDKRRQSNDSITTSSKYRFSAKSSIDNSRFSFPHSQYSISSKKDSTFNSTSIDSTSVKSSNATANENNFSSNLTFAINNIPSSLSYPSLNSFSIDPKLKKSTFRESVTTSKTNQSSISNKKLSRTKPPRIVIRRASNSSLNSIDSLKTMNSNKRSKEKQTIDVHRLAPNKQRSKSNRPVAV